jgi:hypothetical protein
MRSLVYLRSRDDHCLSVAAIAKVRTERRVCARAFVDLVAATGAPIALFCSVWVRRIWLGVRRIAAATPAI